MRVWIRSGLSHSVLPFIVGSTLAFAIYFTVTHPLESLEVEMARISNYRLELLSKKVNTNLHLVDGLVRFACSLLEVYGETELSSIDGYLRREFLLHDEITYLRIFDRTGTIVWSSPFSPPRTELV